MRTAIYVDGLNLYHAIKKTSYKWLNLVELARQVLPRECNVEQLSYFTAQVKGDFDSAAPSRQLAYIKALKTLPEVKVHYGKFVPDTKRGLLLNLPVAEREIWIEAQQPITLTRGDYLVSGRPGQVLPVHRKIKDHTRGRSGRRPSDSIPKGVVVEVQTVVEKRSDVNLAAHLLNDAWSELFDVAAVISNDTDLVTPIDMVRRMPRKRVFIVCPPTYKKVAPDLRKAASDVRRIREKHLQRAQFPERVENIEKPPSW